MGGGFIISFKTVTPKEDYILDIIFEDGYKINFSMTHLIKQLRFSPLNDIDVWNQVEVFSTHLEWNKGTYPVSLNIEGIATNHFDNVI